MRQISTLEPTRYEITAQHADGRTFLICYAGGSPSRRRLLSALQSKGEAIIAKCNVGAEALMTFGTKPRAFAKVGEWTMAYTGRTQRDARNERAEHEFIAA